MAGKSEVLKTREKQEYIWRSLKSLLRELVGRGERCVLKHFRIGRQKAL